MVHCENLTTPVELLIVVCTELTRHPFGGVGSGLLIESDGRDNFDITIIPTAEWESMSEEDRVSAQGFGYVEVDTPKMLPSLCEMYFC